MKRTIFTGISLAIAFFLGFAFKSSTTQNKDQSKPHVTGIGGIFFKCKNPKSTREWYQQHLGLNMNSYGATFEWYEHKNGSKKAQTQWTPFAENSNYFEGDFMINYRVNNLEALVNELKKEGVTIVDSIETFDYGKFVHILDGEGNKIQLWQEVN
jgi:predicted enzyme related to lactoylglutathione lyase